MIYNMSNDQDNYDSNDIIIWQGDVDYNHHDSYDGNHQPVDRIQDQC